MLTTIIGVAIVFAIIAVVITKMRRKSRANDYAENIAVEPIDTETSGPVEQVVEDSAPVVPEPEHTDAPVVEAAEPVVEVVPEVMAPGTEEPIKVATARKRRTGSTTEGQEKKASRRPRKPAKK